MYDSNASRREFLRRLGLSAAGLVSGLSMVGPGLAGCDRKETTNKSSSGGPRKLRFYGTGTLDIGEEGWARLRRDLNIDLAFKDNGNDTGPVVAQMTAGTASADYDLGGLQGGAEDDLAKAGVILPWDLSRVPNWEHTWQWAKDIPYAKWEGKQYGLPLAVNADSMIYLPDRVKAVPGYESGVVDTYAAVFDERLRGKTSMEDAWINSVIFTAIYLKNAERRTIQNPGNLTEAELKDVMGFLIGKKKAGQFRKLWSGWEQGVELLRSGEVWVMTGWEPIVKALTGAGINALYAVPKEGYEGWSNDLLLHAGVQKNGSSATAHDAANWLLGGYYGAKLATLRGYVVPNDRAKQFADSEVNKEFDGSELARVADHVRAKFKSGRGEVHWQNVRPDNYRLYEEWWSKFRGA
jgi:putative spermidine/putrescine transport system substrate-binding protein